jgi:hypothetical protein
MHLLHKAKRNSCGIVITFALSFTGSSRSTIISIRLLTEKVQFKRNNLSLMEAPAKQLQVQPIENWLPACAQTTDHQRPLQRRKQGAGS